MPETIPLLKKRFPSGYRYKFVTLQSKIALFINSLGPTGFDSRQKERVSMPSIVNVARKYQFSTHKRRI